MGIQTQKKERENLPVFDFMRFGDLQIPSGEHLLQSIQKLKEEKGILVFAHQNMSTEIKSVADVTGSSIRLLQKANENKLHTIAFCTSKTTAELSKALSPERKIIFFEPDLEKLYLSLKYELPEVIADDALLTRIEKVLSTEE